MKYLPEQRLWTCAIIGVMFLAGSGSAFAQVSQETLTSIGIPDKVETPIGKLEFFDGVPTQATVETLYDNLDRMWAVEVYLNNQGTASFKASNWLETVPGKSWFTILRMYGPLEPWINKTWRPSEIEPVK